MAALDHIHGSDRKEAGIRAKLSAFVAGIQDARARNAVYRQTIRELNALTARDLDDLGIHRSMITRIAREAAYGTAK
ncbi:DUF1127 domain-containing protein [Paracoccus sp. M683]|uniref:DUF1127 domain-containing protein n=1 Tax=Paracoccus sp. M683 TaxID=2594268 RepID=UPI00117DBA44|nr:DUF1127 domain-containing protein [Paracoccus sp. M683]TRW94823.1 DUF1127 domain-containing protein [Paracoccus sp. M683]